MFSAAVIADQVLRKHPAEPVGDACPACKRVGLEHDIPCGPRVAALGVQRLIRKDPS